MALTLIQAAQNSFNQGMERRAEVYLQFAASAPILQYLPFQTIQGNAISFNREVKLPGSTWRGYNEGYEESTGEIANVVESLSIFGSDLDVDLELIRAFGESIRTDQEQMKIRSMALEFQKTFLKGSKQTNPKEFDGLQARCTGTQLLAAGNTSGGDPLSFSMLDRLKAKVRNPTHFIMSQEMRLKLVEASRDTGISGFVNFTVDSLGADVTSYSNLPILSMEQDGSGDELLPFTEACPGGGVGGASIYCVSMQSASGLIGIQGKELDYRDLGEIESKPVMRSRIDWSVGLAVFDARSICRLWGLSNSPVVS